MKIFTRCLSALSVFASVSILQAGPPADTTNHLSGEVIVEQMRGFDMQGGNLMTDDGKLNQQEQRREMLIKQLRSLGKDTVPVLTKALVDPDVQMRRNATLAMITLAGGYDGQTRMNMSEAVPALISATKDDDSEVRAWAAHALAEVGPEAQAAVPVLVKLLGDPDTGPRNTACMALGAIGPAASEALPALRGASNDPDRDVRQFAAQAIKKIQSQ